MVALLHKCNTQFLKGPCLIRLIYAWIIGNTGREYKDYYGDEKKNKLKRTSLKKKKVPTHSQVITLILKIY